MAELEGKALYTEGKETINVLCYGDSNTYGFYPAPGKFRYDYDKRWTSILEKKLGDKYAITVEGLNGRTTIYDKPDAPWRNGLQPFVAIMGSHIPIDVLVIMLGTNDCNKQLGHSAKDIAAGIDKLVSTAEEVCPEIQGYVPEIIVVAPGAIVDDYADSIYIDELSPEVIQKSYDLGPLYAKVAERHHCKFIDGTKVLDVSPIDCEHLTNKGHIQLAELVYEKIGELDL